MVRDAALHAFCPSCLKIHSLQTAERQELKCCGRRWKLHQGNFHNQRYHCQACEKSSKHRDLQTGTAPRTLIAVEETKANGYRRIRQPTIQDFEQHSLSERFLAENRERIFIPSTPLQQIRWDSRPVSFGIATPSQLFSPRQLAIFGLAFSWIRRSSLAPATKRALSLATSNALATNNKLCGYATDYGRIAPLFSVRSYSLPSLAVELNPLHQTAGRGTLKRSLEKVQRSCGDTIRRYSWSLKERKAVAQSMKFEQHAQAHLVSCCSAADLPPNGGPADFCVFDPPYFDYIAYSELSEFFRVWHEDAALGGPPLLPSVEDPIRSFAEGLSSCLRAGLKRLKFGRPLAFTYHSSSQAAWDALGLAIDQANLLITALWPVRNDSHMGHHTEAGNLEWDLIVVCRRVKECERRPAPFRLSRWVRSARPLQISEADKSCMRFAISMSSHRYGVCVSSLRNGPL